MKQIILSTLGALLLISCAHHQETTQEARQKLEQDFSKEVGTATKADLIDRLGIAEWCKLETSGTETCRFYLKKGTKWIGEKNQKDKKPVETGDQVIAEFDKDGILRSFKASAQR